MDIASAVALVPAAGVYVIVVGLGLTEGAFGGLVLPGAVTLVTAGALAATGAISLPLILSLAVVATLVGDSVGYAIGRRLGAGMTTTRVGRLIGAKGWDRARAILDKGTAALVASRWIGVVRSLVPALVGASGLSYTRFLRANALGVVTYVPAMLLLGYVSVEGGERLGEWAVTYGPAVFAVALSALLVWFAARSRPVVSGRVA